MDAHEIVVSIEAMYEAHRVELTSFATGLVGPDEASDVVSTAMMNMMRRGQHLDNISNHRAYLFQVTYREALRLRRKRAPRSLQMQIDVVSGSTDEAALTTNRIDIFNSVMKLAARQRAVITLVYWLDYSIPETALTLSISEGAVKKHLARARANLRKALGDGQ